MSRSPTAGTDGLAHGENPDGAAGSPVVVSVRPEPEPAVLAAIVAAVEQAWPRPPTTRNERTPRAGTVWRFSGRWWGRPMALSRQRPLIGR